LPPSSPPIVPDALIEEAAIWQARLREPDAGPREREAFRRWLARDPRHRAAYAEAERLWGALDAPVRAMIDANQAQPRPASRAGRPASARAPRRPLRQWAAMAACAALIATGGGWWLQGGLDDLRSDHVTGVGERATASLPDGSAVTLNTDTAIAVDVADDRRGVTLFRGEAHFAVARDEARPFRVETPNATVRVVGTEFNVRLDGDRTVVAVLHGEVAVAASPAAPTAPAHVRAGEQTAVEDGTVGPARPVDAGAVAAWRRGQIVFYRTPLGRVVDELNRYHSGLIVIVDGDLRALSVTGVFDAARPLTALDTIERTLGARSVHLTDRLILLR